MTATDELIAMLAAVLADPEDDTVRLVYADRLQERDEPGDAERAEFIRVQVAWEHVGKAEGCKISPLTDNDRYGTHSPAFCDCCHLAQRQRELWAEFGWQWVEAQSVLEEWDVLPFGERIRWVRGFVHSITCSAEDWIAHADAIFWHPEQTMECGHCVGRRPGSPQAWKMNHPCRVCWGKTRIPKPFVATAHPIREVSLTTWPDGGLFPMLDVHRPERKFTSPRWPGITFTLPPEPV